MGSVEKRTSFSYVADEGQDVEADAQLAAVRAVIRPHEIGRRNDPVLVPPGKVSGEFGAREIHEEIRIERLNETVRVLAGCERHDGIVDAAPERRIQRCCLEGCAKVAIVHDERVA